MQPWIEDIDLQYRQRPIPNFYQLTGKSSAQVDRVLKDGETVNLEPGLKLEAVSTSGHSYDDLSYLIRDKGVLFAGDAIPAREDIPIYINSKKSVESLERLSDLTDAAALYCPAWDKVYRGQECKEAVKQAMEQIRTLQQKLISLMQEHPNASLEMYTRLLCEKIRR